MIRRMLVSIIVVVVAVFVVFLVLNFQGRRIGAAEFVNAAFFVPGGDNLVLNGSFEDGNPDATQFEPIPASNCKALCGGSSALDKWQVSRGQAQNQNYDEPQSGGASDAICWVVGPAVFPDGAIAAQEGNRFLDLTEFTGRAPEQYGAVKQEVQSMEPGSTYELSFRIGTSSKFLPQPASDPAAFYEIDVTVLGVPSAQAAFRTIGPAPTFSQWEQKTLPRFRATGSTTTIIFGAYGSAPPPPAHVGGEYVGIDNVSLRTRRVFWSLRSCSVASDNVTLTIKEAGAEQWGSLI